MKVGIIPASLPWDGSHCVALLLTRAKPNHHSQTHNCNRYFSPSTLGFNWWQPRSPCMLKSKVDLTGREAHPSLYTKYQLIPIKHQSSTILCRSHTRVTADSTITWGKAQQPRDALHGKQHASTKQTTRHNVLYVSDTDTTLQEGTSSLFWSRHPGTYNTFNSYCRPFLA